MKKIYLFTIISLKTLFASAQLYTPGGGVTDIDGNSYQTVIINGREFMSENLRVSKFNNGDAITQDTIPLYSYQDSIPKWYSHENNFQNDLIYGKLYSPNVYKNNRNVCPVNWHVSSDYEWNKTIFFIAQKFQKLNDLDSVLIRSLGVNWGGLNESGLTLTKGNTIYIPDVYDVNGNLITAGYYSFSDTLLSQYGYKTTNDPILGSYEELFSWVLPLNVYGFFYANIRCIKDLNPSNNIAVTAGSGVTDSDGNTYGSAIFGNGQEWMTSNLKTKRFNDGDLMPSQYTNEWPLEGIPATYSYLFNPNNDNTYGRLYSSRMIEYYPDKVCPTGWKVPAMYEWNNLIDYLGGELKAAKKLKSTTGWGDVFIANDHNLLNGTIICDSLVSLEGTNESMMNVKPFGMLADSDDWYGEEIIGFLSATVGSTVGSIDNEGGGAFGMHIGQGDFQYGICNESYDIIYSSFPAVPIDTIFNYLGGDAIFNRDANFAVNAAFSNLGAAYIRCLRDTGSSSSLEQIQIKPTYKIYPNPAKDFITLELNGIDPGFFKIFDNYGREVKCSFLTEKITQIDLNSLKPGYYFIHIENQSVVSKFIIN